MFASYNLREGQPHNKETHEQATCQTETTTIDK